MVVCRVHNILISGKDDREHLNHLNEVLTRLGSAGLWLKLSKCQFMQATFEYLGYQIDAQGLHTIKKKGHSKHASTRKSAAAEIISQYNHLIFRDSLCTL